MKKLITIFVFAIYLFSSTEAYQLFKIPTLIQHYNEHKAEHVGITFIQFLKIHYLEPVKYDADYAQDKQLPFKDHSEDYCFWVVPSMPIQKFEIALTPIPVAKQNTYTYYQCNYSYITAHDIFQPPRTA